MIPEIADDLQTDLEELVEPDKNYQIVDNRIVGTVDGIDAVKQAVFLILNIERYDYPIYSWDFGVELKDLIGQDIDYVMAEVKRRVTEALLQDDRIEDVNDFEFEVDKPKVHVTFTVYVNYGSFEQEMEVEL